MHAAAVQGSGGAAGRLQAALAIGKQQHRVTMGLPETAQQRQRRLRQRNQTVLIALGIADMHAPALGIDIAHLQAQAFTESQAKTVEGDKEDPVTEGAGRQEEALGFLNGDDIGYDPATISWSPHL